MRSCYRWGLAIAVQCFAIAIASGAPVRTPVAGRAIGAGRVGIELDGIGDGNRAKPFVDLAKTLRPWTRADSSGPAPVDSRGWPTCDAVSVLFDVRPAYTWAPPADDPNHFMPDWSGTYPFSFKGQAELTPVEDTSAKVRGTRYDQLTNTTSGEIAISKGSGLLILAFSKTKRTPSSPFGTGITDLRVIRPGYKLNTRQTFTSEFINSLKPFTVLRFMDWSDTNHNPGYYGDAGHHSLNWSDRRRVDDATQQSAGAQYGVAWEYVVELANQTGKDLWINIPVAASDQYVTELAHLLASRLKPRLNVYLEHSNEVWNFGFPQYIYNKLAAIDEVKRGGSVLNRDGSTDEEAWARRRHAKRLIEIGHIFETAFGSGSLNHRIRPVYASWVINPDAYYADVLRWVSEVYGPPNRFIFAVAGAAYFNADKAAPTADVAQILDAMRASSDDQVRYRSAIQRIAEQYGLKNFQYEVGPDTGGGSPVNVANRIRANRDPRIRDVILHDARDNWFARGGDLYMYFSLCSAYSRHGCWGLSEDIADVATPKWEAMYDLVGR